MTNSKDILGVLEDPSVSAFIPSWPWKNGDLQTIRNQALYFGLGFALPTLDESVMTLTWPDGDQSPCLLTEGSRPNAPLVVLIHGLTGCTGSAYMIRSAVAFSKRGFPVLRLNLRAAGAAAKTCKECYHAGRSEDLQALLEDCAALRPDLFAQGIVLMGFSLGGAMMLRFLAHETGASSVRAAVTVSAPLDLEETSIRFRASRNWFYHRWLLARMKADTAPLSLSTKERKAIHHARSVYAFDDQFIAPRFGFTSGVDYYHRMSAEQCLSRIKTPTLMIHALDDPWIPNPQYQRAQKSIGESPYIKLVLTQKGGHVGFHARRVIGDKRNHSEAEGYSDMAYHDYLAALLFEKVCAKC